MLRHHAQPEDSVLEVAVALADLLGLAAGETAAWSAHHESSLFDA